MSPPFVFLTSVKSELRPEIQVAAQNCWVKKGGAFTGEVRYVSKCHLSNYHPFFSKTFQFPMSDFFFLILTKY